MAQLDEGRTGFSDFDQLMELIRRTHAVLDGLVAEGQLPDDGADYLADATLPHLERARGAFGAWLRAEMAGIPELRFLVRQAPLAGDAETPSEREAALVEALVEARLRGGPRRPVELGPDERRGITALSHARLVLGLLPHLPDDEVRLRRGRRTYADIPVPRGPAELVARIEELEREVWRTAVGRAAQPLDPAFRRTYGFFDVAERLSRRGFRLH